MDIHAALFNLLLCMTRLTPLFLLPALTPFAQVPASIRLVFMFALATLALSLPEVVQPEPPRAYTELAEMLASEFLLGMAMNFGLQVAFGAILFTGRLLDMQIGFGAAGVLDPLTQNSEALIGTLLTLCATQLFFQMNFHHDLLRGLALSLRLAPLGSSLGLLSTDWLRGFGQQFLFALMLGAPVITALLLLDTVIAYASRAMPQMNIYFVSLPLKGLVGLVVLALTLRHAAPAFARLFQQGFQSWREVLGG